MADTTVADPLAGKPISRRRQRERDREILTPMAQIRTMGDYEGKPLTGSWAYYIRPEGGTIRDALVISPNGGIPDTPDPRQRARFGANADYYRQREENKGHIYVGQRLNENSVRLLVQTIMGNRDEEIAYVEEEIVNAEFTIQNSDRPHIRDQERQRVMDLKKRLAYLTQDVDPDQMIEELNEISRLQRLATLPPQLLQVMREEISEGNQRLLDQLMQGRKKVPGTKPATRSSGSDFMDLGDEA